MNRLIIMAAIVTVAALTLAQCSPTRAAMEEEEILVRLTTGKSVKVTVNPRKPPRRHRRRHQR